MSKKLTLNRETLRQLVPEDLKKVNGGIIIIVVSQDIGCYTEQMTCTYGPSIPNNTCYGGTCRGTCRGDGGTCDLNLCT